MRAVGIEAATELCRELMAGGVQLVPLLHTQPLERDPRDLRQPRPRTAEDAPTGAAPGKLVTVNIVLSVVASLVAIWLVFFAVLLVAKPESGTLRETARIRSGHGSPRFTRSPSTRQLHRGGAPAAVAPARLSRVADRRSSPTSSRSSGTPTTPSSPASYLTERDQTSGRGRSDELTGRARPTVSPRCFESAGCRRARGTDPHRRVEASTASCRLHARRHHAGMERRRHRGARDRGDHRAFGRARRIRSRLADRDRSQHGGVVGALRHRPGAAAQRQCAVIGTAFVLLAVYLAIQSTYVLVVGDHAEHSRARHRVDGDDRGGHVRRWPPGKAASGAPSTTRFSRPRVASRWSTRCWPRRCSPAWP